MSEIVAIVEGPTEQTFVRDVLAPHLGQWGASMWAVLSGKSRRQGGVRNWQSARNDICRILSEGRFCTTMFDFYGMPSNWPEREDAGKLAYDERGARVEAGMNDDLSEVLDEKWDARQFLPYVQMHEFEALLFSDVEKLAAALSAQLNRPARFFSPSLTRVVSEAGSPEAIDDGYETCPSRRILGVAGSYRKSLIGPIVARNIGLDVLRVRCKHFGSWLCQLENVAQA